MENFYRAKELVESKLWIYQTTTSLQTENFLRWKSTYDRNFTRSIGPQIRPSADGPPTILNYAQNDSKSFHLILKRSLV